MEFSNERTFPNNMDALLLVFRYAIVVRRKQTNKQKSLTRNNSPQMANELFPQINGKPAANHT